MMRKNLALIVWVVFMSSFIVGGMWYLGIFAQRSVNNSERAFDANVVNGIRNWFLKSQRSVSESNCVTTINSNDPKVSIRIEDPQRFSTFIDSIGNCNDGVFLISDVGTTTKVSTLEYVIVNEVQDRSFTNQQGNVYYTFSIDVTSRNQGTATLKLHFPQDNSTIPDIDERMASAIVLRSYSMFTGQAYTIPDARVTKYSTLDAIGLIHENK